MFYIPFPEPVHIYNNHEGEKVTLGVNFLRHPHRLPVHTDRALARRGRQDGPHSKQPVLSHHPPGHLPGGRYLCIRPYIYIEVRRAALHPRPAPSQHHVLLHEGDGISRNPHLGLHLLIAEEQSPCLDGASLHVGSERHIIGVVMGGGAYGALPGIGLE